MSADTGKRSRRTKTARFGSIQCWDIYSISRVTKRVVKKISTAQEYWHMCKDFANRTLSTVRNTKPKYTFTKSCHHLCKDLLLVNAFARCLFQSINFLFQRHSFVLCFGELRLQRGDLALRSGVLMIKVSKLAVNSR